MTIAIAAYGPAAGLAVVHALRAAERVAWGAIGGFASFAIITEDHSLIRYETQRGGTSTLFVEGERTGAEPPPAVQKACIAAVISSGPDRPAPLAQFVAGDADVGLVTGHRLPNRPGSNGVPINTDVLLHLADNHTPQQAVDTVLNANPQADAGVIAVDLSGQIYARNTERVARRPDLGNARLEHHQGKAVVEVLHNAIYPLQSLACLVAEMAMETMLPRFQPQRWLTARAGTAVSLGASNTLIVDADLVVQQVLTTDARLLHGLQDGAAIYIGSEVHQNNCCIGTTITEPYVILEDGIIRLLSGQDSVRIGFQHD